MNEFNAVRLCILKAISSVPYNTGGKCTNVKTISVDVPCSQELFRAKFVSCVDEIKYLDEDNYKCSVSATHLTRVFGHNWHTFNYRRSLTRRRIIGLIVIHFRRKVLPLGFVSR